tara:strand:+ start:1257 stop:1829 length:573 start_codon:yes stop_codon:yes gene_type:complete
MKVMFLHGLEGSPEGLKATYLCEKYNAVVPKLDMSELIRLKGDSKNWSLVDRYDILWASRIPLRQVREAITENKPDIIVGSSMGGALLAKMIIENAWSGPSVFLASASKMMFDISKVSPATGKKCRWIHGSMDDVVPLDDSIDISKASGGSLEVIDDDHRLEKIIELGSLDEAIMHAGNYVERSLEKNTG